MDKANQSRSKRCPSSSVRYESPNTWRTPDCHQFGPHEQQTRPGSLRKSLAKHTWRRPSVPPPPPPPSPSPPAPAPRKAPRKPELAPELAGQGHHLTWANHQDSESSQVFSSLLKSFQVFSEPPRRTPGTPGTPGTHGTRGSTWSWRMLARCARGTRAPSSSQPPLQSSELPTLKISRSTAWQFGKLHNVPQERAPFNLKENAQKGRSPWASPTFGQWTFDHFMSLSSPGGCWIVWGISLGFL